MHSPSYTSRSVTGLWLLRSSIMFSTGELSEAAAGTAHALRKISARVDDVYLHDTML